MKRKLVESEPGYLRDRREAGARPAANVLAGLLLSAASILCAAMIVPAADLTEETCAAQTASAEKTSAVPEAGAGSGLRRAIVIAAHKLKCRQSGKGAAAHIAIAPPGCGMRSSPIWTVGLPLSAQGRPERLIHSQGTSASSASIRLGKRYRRAQAILQSRQGDVAAVVANGCPGDRQA